jgi:hypothetical protein
VAATAVKQYADRHGITELQSAQPAVSFEDSWKLVSVAALIGDLQGIYRGETGSNGTWVYIGFGPVVISNDDSTGLGPPMERILAPKAQLDFSSIDSPEKADVLHQKGELALIHLFPVALGGPDHRVNQVLVPPFVIALKNRFDQQVAELMDAGLVSHYTASPLHRGQSVVPYALTLEAKSDAKDGSTAKERIDIW